MGFATAVLLVGTVLLGPGNTRVAKAPNNRSRCLKFWPMSDCLTVMLGSGNAKVPKTATDNSATSLSAAFNVPALQGLKPSPLNGGRPRTSMRPASSVKGISMSAVPMDYWERMEWAKKERLAFAGERKQRYAKRATWKDTGGRTNSIRTLVYDNDMSDMEETPQTHERMSKTDINQPTDVLVFKASGPITPIFDESKVSPTSEPAHANLLPMLPRSIGRPASTVIATLMGGLEAFKFYERKAAVVLMKMADDVKKSRVDQVMALVSKPSPELPPAENDTVYALAAAKNQLLSDKTGRLSEIATKQGLRKAGLDPEYGLVPVMELGEAVVMPVLLPGMQLNYGGVNKMQRELLLQIVSHAATMGRLVGISPSNERFQKIYEDLGFENVPLQYPGFETFMVYTKPMTDVQGTNAHAMFDLRDLEVA